MILKLLIFALIGAGLYKMFKRKKIDESGGGDKGIYSTLTGETLYVKLGLDGEQYFQMAKPFAEAEDYAMAVQLLKLSCEADHAIGCFELGKFYEDGFGVDEDYHMYISLLKKSCSLGYSGGCLNLGNYYLEDEENYKLAKKYYEQAKNLGHPIAFYNLGIMYGRGIGMEKDLDMAKKLFEKSCSLGHEIACGAIDKL